MRCRSIRPSVLSATTRNKATKKQSYGVKQEQKTVNMLMSTALLLPIFAARIILLWKHQKLLKGQIVNAAFKLYLRLQEQETIDSEGVVAYVFK